MYLEKEQILAPIFDFHKYGHFMCRVVHCLVNACQGTCWLHTWSKADKIMNKVRMEAHCSPLIINMFAESPLACLTMDGAKRKFQETGRNYHGLKARKCVSFLTISQNNKQRTYPVHHHELNGKKKTCLSWSFPSRSPMTGGEYLTSLMFQFCLFVCANGTVSISAQS